MMTLITSSDSRRISTTAFLSQSLYWPELVICSKFLFPHFAGGVVQFNLTERWVHYLSFLIRVDSNHKASISERKDLIDCCGKSFNFMGHAWLPISSIVWCKRNSNTEEYLQK